MGPWTYALGKGKSTAAAEAIRIDSIAAADAIVKRSAQNGYKITMTPRHHVWGSNGVVGNHGLQLLAANVFKPKPAYVHAAPTTCIIYWAGTRGQSTMCLRWGATRACTRMIAPAALPASRTPGLECCQAVRVGLRAIWPRE